MSDFKEKQRTLYKEIASQFDSKQKRDNRNHRNKIFATNNFLDIQNNDRVLEIGVGSGIHAHYMVSLNLNKEFSFVGVDYSSDMLNVSKEKLIKFNNVELHEMDGEKLLFEDESFDKVYISGSLHHFPNPEKGISELLRDLKKTGKFCIMEPNYIFPTNFYACHKIEEEKNKRLMRRDNFKKWLSKHRNVSYKIVNFAYTPPFPKIFIPIYNLLDMFISYLYPLNRLSVMLFVMGDKHNV